MWFINFMIYATTLYMAYWCVTLR